MSDWTEAELLRVYLSENDRAGGRPLHVAIVEEAFRRGLPGATVLRGVLGFGARHRMHASHILELSDDLPLVIEIVDSVAAVEAFLPALESLAPRALITRERVRVAPRAPHP